MSQIKITTGNNIGVFLWRKIIVPLLENILGKNFQKGIVQEYAYGKLASEKLDYIAPNNSYSKDIAIVHIHGGGFVSGSKGKIYSKTLLKFSNDGYPVFSINYPLAPEQQHPYILHSLLNALAWIKTNYSQYNAIHLVGDSAGGNLAMMLGIYIANPELLKSLTDIEIDGLPRIKSVSNCYGVNDRISWIEDGFPSAKLFSKMYFENTTDIHIPMTPMDFETITNLPATFIAGAGTDKLLRSSKIWAERTQKQFEHVQFKIYEGASHGFFSAGKGSDELIDDILSFINKVK